MTERLEFWKGVTVGLMAGMTAAALARFATPQKLAPGQGEILRPPPSGDLPSRKDTLEFRLRREDPESAGDPALLSPGRAATSVTTFERPGGAPGGAAEVERLDMPGRPGQKIDHSDASTPVRMVSRSLDLNGQSQSFSRHDWSS